MAYRRCLLVRGKVIDRSYHPSLSHILNSSNDERKNREISDEKKSSSIDDITSSFFMQTRSFGSSLNGGGGKFAYSQDRFLSPYAGYNLCRHMSSSSSKDAQQGLGNTELITDAANVLTDKTMDAANVLSDKTMDAVASQLPAFSEVAIAAADSYAPVQALQYLIDSVHTFTGLNWWGSIIITTILIRSCTIPLLISQLKATSKLTLMRPHLEVIKEEMDGRTMDPDAVAEGQRKMNKLFKEYGVSPFTPLKGMFISGPIFVSFFLAISNMAEKMPSFKHGGAFWFTDLSTPDPLYIFPVLAALSFLITVEANVQEGMEGNPMAVTMKKFSRVLAVLTVPFTMTFPKAIFCYWVTSNLFSLMYGMVLRVPGVKQTLGVPEIPIEEPTTSSPKSPFSLFPALKQAKSPTNGASSIADESSKHTKKKIASSAVISQRLKSLEKQVKGRKKSKK